MSCLRTSGFTVSGKLLANRFRKHKGTLNTFHKDHDQIVTWYLKPYEPSNIDERKLKDVFRLHQLARLP